MWPRTSDSNCWSSRSYWLAPDAFIREAFSFIVMTASLIEHIIRLSLRTEPIDVTVFGLWAGDYSAGGPSSSFFMLIIISTHYEMYSRS